MTIPSPRLQLCKVRPFVERIRTRPVLVTVTILPSELNEVRQAAGRIRQRATAGTRPVEARIRALARCTREQEPGVVPRVRSDTPVRKSDGASAAHQVPDLRARAIHVRDAGGDCFRARAAKTARLEPDPRECVAGLAASPGHPRPGEHACLGRQLYKSTRAGPAQAPTGRRIPDEQGRMLLECQRGNSVVPCWSPHSRSDGRVSASA